MKIGFELIYGSYKELVIHSENISWSRLQNLLTINSILVVAWATLYVNCDKNCSFSAKAVMTGICVIGFVTGIAWAFLGKAGRKYLDLYKSKLKDIEARYDKSCHWIEDECIPISDRPFQIHVDSCRLTSSSFLLAWTPILFALLSVVLLVATWSSCGCSASASS